MQGTWQAQYENQRILNDEQLRTLTGWINKLTERGLLLLNEMLRNFAKEIRGSEDKPGRQWPNRWRKRYDEIIAKYATGIGRSHKSADSAYKYALYFELINIKIQQYNIKP